MHRLTNRELSVRGWSACALMNAAGVVVAFTSSSHLQTSITITTHNNATPTWDCSCMGPLVRANSRGRQKDFLDTGGTEG